MAIAAPGILSMSPAHCWPRRGRRTRADSPCVRGKNAPLPAAPSFGGTTIWNLISARRVGGWPLGCPQEPIGRPPVRFSRRVLPQCYPCRTA
jgi:hypothetical protein